MLQLPLPETTEPVHVSAPPLTVTVTSPVGAPLPGEFTVTSKFTVTLWPTDDGSGLSEVIVVVVAALFTV
jgi:hypothetical protein